jgi:DNA sulfur modification protein DndE
MKKTCLIALIAVAFAFQLPQRQIRVFMIGDSTMADKPLNDNPERGWGQLLPGIFQKMRKLKTMRSTGEARKVLSKKAAGIL